MSIIEDVRKGIQDLVTPDMRAISARLDMLEKQMAELKSDMKAGFAEAERRAEKRHEDLTGNIRQVVDYAVVLQRLSHLEEQQKRIQQ